MVNDLYGDCKGKIGVAGSENGMRANDPVITDDIACPSCSRPMMIRTGTTGVFLGCSGYDLPPKERCKETINLIPGDDSVDVDEDNEDSEVNALRKKHRCSTCSTAMESYLIDEQRKLHVCGNNPDCSGHEIEQGTFKIKGYEGPIVDCDKCGSDMQLKSGRFGKYFGCTNEECKNTRKLLRSGEVAPPKADPIPMKHLLCEKNDDYFLLRDGASGMFLAASQFPRHRETRAPLVEELVSVKDQLDPKFAFLVEAPTEDPDGNKAVIRYSRKTKQQYVMTEVEGKATGWKALFAEGKWEQTLAPKKVVKKKAPAKKKAAAKKKADKG